jgi:glycosyltransferase involved in cell wall biosynthesis
LGLLGVWKLAFSPLSRKKLVWWLSGHEPTENALKSAFRRSLRKIIYCRASAFIVYGSAGKKYLESLGIKKKIFIAYNAVGTAEIETVKKNWIEREEGLESLKPFRSALPHSLLYIGRLSHGKRADLLPEIILALDELSGSQQFGLIVIGDGPALNAVKEKSRRLGLEERIVFTGAIQGIENTGPFFLAADLLLLPGKGGLAINEAVQYGLPVVVGKADGTEEDLVIPGKNGAIILSEHPRDFAEAILRITAKPESVSEMKQASLEIAECIANTSRMKEGFMNAIAVIIESRHNEV